VVVEYKNIYRLSGIWSQQVNSCPVLLIREHTGAHPIFKLEARDGPPAVEAAGGLERL